MKIAAQLYTVREYCKDWEGINNTFDKIALLGYKVIQLSGFNQFDPVSLKKRAKELGLEICATHTPFKRIICETEQVIEEHLIYEAKYVGLGTHDVSTIEKCKKFLDDIMPCIDKIYSAGLKFLFHNHAAEFKRLENGKNSLEYLIENTKKEKFGILADLYWVQFAGISPVDFIKQYKNNLDVVHLKDMTVIDNTKVTFAEVFEGNMDYEKIISTCVENGIKYAAVEQDVCQGNPFDSLKKSLDNINIKCPYLFNK